ncbi:hypothetical protein LINPERHAP1_LOCUS45009 [Linum perenne]
MLLDVLNWVKFLN